MRKYGLTALVIIGILTLGVIGYTQTGGDILPSTGPKIFTVPAIIPTITSNRAAIYGKLIGGNTEIAAKTASGEVVLTTGGAIAETDPLALKTAGTDNVKDTHLDWGSGAGQIDADDMPASSTKEIPTIANVSAGVEAHGWGDHALVGYAMPNTDAYLTTPITTSFYVDKNRGDTYTADGSITKPFKTIQAAINQVIANGDNTQTKPYIINIAPGTYAENLVLEDLAIHSLVIKGTGSRFQTLIDPPSGYALQSIANNAHFYDLHMENIQFNDPTIMVGDTATTYFGYNFFFVDCYWPSTAAATFRNMVYPAFSGDAGKFSGGLTVSNVTQMGLSNIGGIKTAAFTIETDESALKPYSFSGGTKILAQGFAVPNATWSLLNISTLTGTTLQLRGARYGSAGETIPANGAVLAYYSALIGNYVNNGTLTLYNTTVSGTLTGTAPVLYQPGTLIKNTPAGNIAAVTVQAALNELDSEKLSSEADTLDSVTTRNASTTNAITVGGLTNDGVYTQTPAADGAYHAADAITCSHGIMRVAGDGGAVVLTGTPTIVDGVDGQVCILQGTSDTNTLQIQDAAQLASSGLVLSANVDFMFGVNDTLTLMYDAGEDKWVELSRSDN